jgi:type II secretory ATPase GspE/PulE/Tfp pilus assembly ATPase PilB-like protein
LLEGLSEGQIQTLFQNLIPAQKIGLKAGLKEAPCGIVAIHGCAGAGKTITVYTALNAMLAQGKKVIVASLTN